ncbi:reverse transcriptase domain-containing protein [Tanacetum coccineum]
MLFPLSHTGEAKTWLDELNKETIETWDELCTAFISLFFPSSLFNRLLREIRAFSQHENETLTESWLRMKEILKNYHGHNLSKANIIKNFYRGLNQITQEVLNAATGGIFLYKTPNQAYQLLEDKVLLKLDWAKNQKTKSSLKKTVAFADEGSGNSDSDRIMARMDAMTMKIDAHEDDDEESKPQPKSQTPKLVKETLIPKPYKPKIPNAKLCKAFLCNALADLGANINLMPYSLYAKLSLETLKPTKISVRLADRSFQHPIGIAKNMLVKVGRPFLNTADVVIRVKQKQLNLRVDTERITFSIDSAMKHSYLNEETCFSIDVINEILEKDFDALLDEGIKILHSIKGTILEEKLFVEFDEFKANHRENSESESDTEEPPIEKITFNTDYKIKTSLKEPPSDLELKPFPDNLEYVFLEELSFLPIIISSQLSEHNKNKLVSILKRHKQASAWKTTDIPGIFDIKIKDNKGTENVAADHLSRIVNDETSDDSDVDDNFPRETLMKITMNDTPWFADFANYLVGDIIPKGMTYRQKNKFFFDLKNYF